ASPVAYGSADVSQPQGMLRTMRGPRKRVKAKGIRCQTRTARRNFAESGDGVPATCELRPEYHHSASSTAPHCSLNLCVALPNVQRPKLKRESPSLAARSISAQYTAIFGLRRLYARSADAQVISNSPSHRRP